MRNQGYHTPDWVICGAPTDDGVMVLASKDLSMAELEMHRDVERVYGIEMMPHLVAGRTTFTLKTTMGSITIIIARDYGEAFTNLWKSWTPNNPRGKEIGTQPAIAMGKPEIEGP